MAARSNSYWYNLYRKALEFYDVKLKELKKPTKKSLEKAKREWKKAQIKAAKKGKEKLKLRETYNKVIEKEKQDAEYRDTPRDENMNTAPATNMYDASMDIINEFLMRIEQIWQDTLAEREQAMSHSTHESGKLGALIDRDIMQITEDYNNLVSYIYQMLDEANGNADYVARAIMQNGELDYTLAATFMPPSDLIRNFAVTYEQLSAIWESIIAQARTEAETNWT